MKMYLGSYRVAQPKALEELLGKTLKECSALVINNSKDRRPEENREEKNQAGLKYWQGLVSSADMASLYDLGKPAQMLTKIKSYDMLVFLGGDNEALREAMIHSGFDEIAQEVFESVVFVGESAGAVMVGPNLSLFRYFAKGDKVYKDTDTAEGLGVIDEIIFPHEDSPDPRYFKRGAQMAEIYTDKNLVPLGDDQALIVNGDSRQVVGKMRSSYYE